MSHYIIVVEDDHSLATIYEKSLQNAGYEVAIDRDGSQWKKWLKQRRPDLLILDMHTPFSWGPDIIETLKNDADLQGIPRIVATADIIVGKNLQKEGERVLIKPVGVERLLDAVAKALS